MILTRINLAFLTLFFMSFPRLFLAAVVRDFYFLKAETEISESLNDPLELSKKLNLMNVDSRHLEKSKSLELINEYISAQERISRILLNAHSIDFSNPKLLEFTSHLMRSLENEPHRFNPETLGDVFGILFATGNPFTASKIRKLLESKIRSMPIIPKLKFYQYLIIHLDL